jgi:glycolate oxidase
MGKGGRIPTRQTGSDAPHAIRLRIGDDKVSTTAEDAEAARSDFSPLPGRLGGIFSRTPEAVVRPETAEDAADAVGICFEERSRVVPRGAATSGLGGAVPVRGGVVIDVTNLSGVVDIDRKKETATVEAGTRWDDVIETLGREGFAPASYPTSACLSTVGGWISSGGYGAGTLKHGNFHSQITSLEVGLPSGFLVKATGQQGRYSVPSFAGTEGQLGVITKATFRVRRAPEKRATFAAHLGSLEDGARILESLAGLENVPFSAELLDPGAARLYGNGWEGPLLMAVGEGSATDVDALSRAFKDSLTGTGADIDTAVEAREAWARKTRGLSGGRGERPYTSGSVLFRKDSALPYVLYIIERRGRDEELLFECRAVDRAKTLVTVAYREERGRLSPFKALARVRNLVARGVGMGGVPYGVGLWNSPYIDVILGSRKKELRRIKGEVDRLRIMNPGKFFQMTTRSGLRVPGWAIRACFGIAGRS